ncbi:zinc finger protein 184 [Drosophila ficusphila]|uniref:zinc finger protein 184 n=1 Tax=Drosophila ficusphila TaxID=30025 RepID=UPI0007E6ECC5|nr:zinc finger protein 184 [Drosophila ficusphila]
MFSLLLHHPLVCRCCLLEQPPLYHSLHDASSRLAEELKALAPALLLHPGDNLTDVICDLCLRRLHDARDFQRRCEHSEQVLRSRHEQWKHTVAVGDALALDDVLECLEREVGSLEGPGTSEPQQPGKPVAYVAPLMETVDFESLEFQESPCSDFRIPTYWESPLDTGSLNTPPHQPETAEPFEVALPELPTPPESPEEPAPKPAEKPKRRRTKPRPDIQKAKPKPKPKTERTANTPRSLHPCAECEKKFTRNFQLKLHMIAVHGVGEMRYQCEECGKSFASRHSLRYHVKSVHSTERPFGCQHCDRRFVLRTQLLSHLRTHTGEAKPRIFACQRCSKTWPTKSDLRTHMRSHNPNMERPFKCDRCSKAFFTRGHLSSHLLVHTGEKPFACEYCDKCYQSVGNLNNHMVRQHADIIEAQLESSSEAVES